MRIYYLTNEPKHLTRIEHIGKIVLHNGSDNWLNLMNDTDIVIIDISNESTEAGFIIKTAQVLGKPVLCLYNGWKPSILKLCPEVTALLYHDDASYVESVKLFLRTKVKQVKQIFFLGASSPKKTQIASRLARQYNYAHVETKNYPNISKYITGPEPSFGLTYIDSIECRIFGFVLVGVSVDDAINLIKNKVYPTQIFMFEQVEGFEKLFDVPITKVDENKPFE
jgi:hypothetical protein